MSSASTITPMLTIITDKNTLCLVVVFGVYTSSVSIFLVERSLHYRVRSEARRVANVPKNQVCSSTSALPISVQLVVFDLYYIVHLMYYTSKMCT